MISTFTPAAGVRQQTQTNFFRKNLRIQPRWLLTIVVCLLMQTSIARVWYISPTGSGNGSGDNWANTTSALQTIMYSSNSGDEIWIKAGDYKSKIIVYGGFVPTFGFELKNGVKVYGGFNGTETSINQRSADLTLNKVTLSSDNTNYSIIKCTDANNSTLLDRLTIADGYANSAQSSSGYGGGLYLLRASITVNNVNFVNNKAGFGGGAVYSESGNPVFTNVTFSNNNCTNGGGGGVANSNGIPEFTNVTFTNNSAEFDGGAIYNISGNPKFTSVNFDNNKAGSRGGAMFDDGGSLIILNSTFTSNYAYSSGGALNIQNIQDVANITNVTFSNNSAGYKVESNGTVTNNSNSRGGALYSFYSNCNLDKAAFQNNYTGGSGGAIFNTRNNTSTPQRIPRITNAVFFSNGSKGSSGNGGAVANENSAINIINSTVFSNFCGISGKGGGVYTSGSANTTIINCILLSNKPNLGLPNDVANTSPATVSITYSSFNEVSAYPSGNNIGSVIASSVFINSIIPVGADGKWLTADDGLQLLLCGNTLIDKGNNNAITYTTDATGRPRKVDVPIVPDGGLGTAPFVDMGAYENQNSTTTPTLAALTGSIQGNDTIPNPQEVVIDTIKSISSPLNVAGRVIQWQSKTGNNSWAPAAGTNNQVNYNFTTLSATTSFRRAVTLPSPYCNTFYSNEMQMYVYTPEVNNRIKGKVLNRNGAGVPGVDVNIIRRGAGTPGSPAGFTYHAFTDNDGFFSKTGIYFGPNTNSTDSFFIVPQLAGHRIVRNNPDSADRISVKLKVGDNQSDNNNFTDVTVLSVRGKTYQRCIDCIDSNGVVINPFKSCPLDSVKIIRAINADSVYSVLNADSAVYGLNIISPGTYSLTAKFKNHLFSPSLLQLAITGDVYDQNFEDTTQYTISGRLTAGCNDSIGSAVMIFSDVTKNRNGTIRPACFRKKVTTTTGGRYSVRLPAGKYKVYIDAFTSAYASTNTDYFIGPDVLKTFFNELTPSDSLISDISTANATLNLVYVRPPQLVVTKGLDTTCAPGVYRNYALIKQGIIDSFTVKVFQGSPILNAGAGCLWKDTTNPIIVSTSIQQKGLAPEELTFDNTDTGVVVRLTGGTPYTIAPYYKPLSIRYTDRYNRIAPQLNRNVVVTGVKPDDGATFTTVSPQIPLMVLHDPPGDQSYSTWATSQKQQMAFRMYAESGESTKIWSEIKLGTKQEVGPPGVTTSLEFWGKVKDAITFDATAKTGTELILSSTVTNEYNTNAAPGLPGANSDLFIGTALNLICVGSDVLTYNSDSCKITQKRELVVANDGFAPNTDYVYTQFTIETTIIPRLQELVDAKPDSATYFRNQIKVWQQLLENNRQNKLKATFDKNISFGGSGGLIRSSTTSSASNTNTIEFKLGFSTSLAAELGFDIAGSGVSGGAEINVKVETGTSIEGTVIEESTIGYTLGDQNISDVFNVNVKKDPNYGTPMFELLAGETSCPVELGSYPRDQFEIYAPVNTLEGVPANGTATFQLKLANTNVHESRYYYLTFEQVSNPFGARIEVGGSPYTSAVYYVIPPASEVQVIVNVTRPVNSNVYDFNDLQFSINDSCYKLGKTIALNARFQSPCSGITIGIPENNWILAANSYNVLPILLKEYTKYALSSIRLEYAKAGTSVWNTAITKSAAELGTDSTTLYWNVAGLNDGEYKIRIAVICSQGTNYTTSVTGIIDRKGPELFGRPAPTNDQYVRGDQISFSYSEKLDINNLNNGRVTLDKRSNNQFAPVAIAVSGFDNKIIITPAVSITKNPGDTMRVVVRNMTDVYGNIKTQPDTSFFIVGISPISTANNALIVSVINPVISKTSDSAISVAFKLPVVTNRNVRVNYTISGTARYGTDYIIEYTTPQPSFAFYNGVQGSAQIDSSTNQVMLKIRSIDTSFNSNKTIIINLSEGGDYAFGANTTATGTLLNEDGRPTYTFSGNGNFNVRSNWLNNRMPLTTLAAGKTIYINPSGTCTLNVPLTIRQGATLRIMQNKPFIILGSLKLN